MAIHIQPQPPRKQCFPPVADARTRLLVLGSLPGEQSLAAGQYYAHRQNRFWHLMSAVLEADLTALSYPDRLACLLQHRVGLWDVVAEASRDGSLDSCIRAQRGNDLVALLATLPELRALAFNGGTAARIGQQLLGEAAARYRIIALPSSSPAYTLPLHEKTRRWLGLRAVLGEGSTG